MAASYTNLANPGTYDAAPGTAPAFATGTGWTFNSTSQYLTTGLNCGNGYTLAVRFSDVAAATGLTTTTLIADKVSGSSLYRIIATNISSAVRYYSGGAQIKSPGLATGVLVSAGGIGYRDGVLDATGTDTFTTGTGIIIGRFKDGSTPAPTGAGLNGKIQAIAIYDTVLTADQVAAVSTAMAAL